MHLNKSGPHNEIGQIPKPFRRTAVLSQNRGMPTLNVTDIKRIAAAAAQQVSPALKVLGVTLNAGGSDYVEIMLEISGCRTEPCQLVVGVFRNVSESALTTEIAGKLRGHLLSHQG